MKYYALFNPYSGKCEGELSVKPLEKFFPEIEAINVTDISDYKDFFGKINEDDVVIICGGDGTLNRLINQTDNLEIKNEILYFPAGSGNDFANDLGKKAEDGPFKINEYLKDLPYVYVKGNKYRFLNGIGYGIDGYCCEVGDEQKKKSKKAVNYTTIAIKGLLFFYKRTNATVMVDGKEYSYKKVWFAPTMHGRFFGGGMMCAPNQDRLNKDRSLSLVVLNKSSKLRTLMIFPTIFKGEHIKHTDIITVHTGHDITVKFDKPTALQIDGETIKNVTEYTARSVVAEKKADAVCLADSK